MCVWEHLQQCQKLGWAEVNVYPPVAVYQKCLTVSCYRTCEIPIVLRKTKSSIDLHPFGMFGATIKRKENGKVETIKQNKYTNGVKMKTKLKIPHKSYIWVSLSHYMQIHQITEP